MYVRWGSYTHALAEVGFTTSKTPINAGGFMVGVEEVWNLTGFLQAGTQAALVTACTALEYAYGRNQQTAQILLSDGVSVARQMPGIHPLGGTEVVAGVSYPNDGMGNNGAEFVSHRTFTVSVKGRYALPNSSTNPKQLISFSERVQFMGGGPLDTHVESQVGLPQKQRLKQHTTFHATQTGSAVGLYTWPDPEKPLWPSAQIFPQQPVTVHNPKRDGGANAQIYTEHLIEWNYVFQSALPLLLTVRPNKWR